MAFTNAWQSSKVPSIATACTLLSETVVIMRCCTSEMRPRGNSTTTSTCPLPLNASAANAYAAVGMAESGLGRLDAALAHFRQATAQLERLVADHPQNVTWNRDLMLAYGHVADVLGNPGLQNLGDRAGALRAYRQAADIGKRLYEADRADQRAAADYGIVLSRVETMIEDRDHDAKRAVQQASIHVLEEAARVSPGNISLKIYLSLVYQHLGDSWTAARDVVAAHDAYVKSEAVASTGMQSGHAALYLLFIQIHHKLALNAVLRGHRAEALALARRAFEAGQNPPQGSGPLRALPRGLSAMALTYTALLRSPLRTSSDRQDALTWLGRSLESWRAAQAEPGFGDPHRREMHDVELALAAVQSQAIDRASVSRPLR